MACIRAVARLEACTVGCFKYHQLHQETIMNREYYRAKFEFLLSSEKEYLFCFTTEKGDVQKVFMSTEDAQRIFHALHNEPRLHRREPFKAETNLIEYAANRHKNPHLWETLPELAQQSENQGHLVP